MQYSRLAHTEHGEATLMVLSLARISVTGLPQDTQKVTEIATTISPNQISIGKEHLVLPYLT